MKQEIKVPQMGESITEATVGQILKKSGTVVAVDEEILELETDKVNQVLHAPVSGVVEIVVKPDEVVKIGQVVGYVEPGEAPAPKKEEVKPAAPPVEKAPSVRESKTQYVAKLEEKKPAPAPKTGARETRKKMSKIRRVIADRLVEAQQATAMLTTFNEVDLSEVIRLREQYKETFVQEHGVKLGFMSFFVKAVVSSLKEFPELNSYIDGDDIVHREYFDIGIAIGADRGLVVPVVRDCDTLTFAQIEQAIVAFAKAAREGKLSVDDLQGGGFTITNGGTYGSLLSTPIINYPQSGILGMHKIEKRPIAVDNEVVIRPMMYIAMSYDHRVVDGKQAVGFLVHVKECLEDPARLILEV